MSLLPTKRHGRLPRTGGFTLLEIVVTLLLIGFWPALVAPMFRRAHRLTTSTPACCPRLVNWRYVVRNPRARGRRPRTVAHLRHRRLYRPSVSDSLTAPASTSRVNPTRRLFHEAGADRRDWCRGRLCPRRSRSSMTLLEALAALVILGASAAGFLGSSRTARARCSRRQPGISATAVAEATLKDAVRADNEGTTPDGLRRPRRLSDSRRVAALVRECR